MGGFPLDIRRLPNGDVEIEWEDQAVATYEVWTSADPYFEPFDAGASLIDLGGAHSFVTTAEGEAYYRIRAAGAAVELSTTVGQIDYDLYLGYTKLGVCLVSDADSWVELQADMPSDPGDAYMWDAATQAWISGSALENITLDPGRVISVQHESAPSPDHYGWLGHVPTLGDISVSLLPGDNLVTTLPLRFGPTMTSDLLAMVEDGLRIGSWDPATQTTRWHPDDGDWLLPTCSPVHVEVSAPSSWPPPGGSGGDGGSASGTGGAGTSSSSGAGSSSTSSTTTGDSAGGEVSTGASADDGGSASGAESGASSAGGEGGEGDDDGGGDLPPDPSSVAPPLDATVTTRYFDAISFLFLGDPPIQSGVEEGTIEPERVAVLRGTVRERDGATLGGVLVTAVGHPEYGSTRTRADGRFDFAVNGGESLLLSFMATDMLPVQRTVRAKWQADTEVPAVAMIPVDAEVSVIDFSDPIEMHIASEVTDGDGTRTNVLLFREGTVATMVGAGGAEADLTSISVRATEYTVGDEGPAAMPGNLPTASAYTYAVEYTIDEAEAAGAVRVELSPPAIAYLDNFIGFPVGGNVPLGAYDARTGTWAAEPDGIVLEIVGTSGGLAELDLTGDGVAEGLVALAAAGIDDDEREALAGQFSVGMELWRMPVPHMSPWDANWGRGPGDVDPPPPGQLDPPAPPPNSCKESGSIIECEGQVLGQELPVAGTPYSLAYRTDRVPGRDAAYRLRVPVWGPEEPAPSPQLRVEFGIAGRHFAPPVSQAWSENGTYEFAWDGLDAYGRRPQGPVPVDACVLYTYPMTYVAWDGTTGTGGSSFGYNGNGQVISGERNGNTLTFTYCHTLRPLGGGLPIDAGTLSEVSKSWGDRYHLGVFDARRSAAALGGWTLSAHHTLAPESGVLYLGDGSRIDNAHPAQSFTVARFAGALSNPSQPNDGDGGPALDAWIGNPLYGAMGPDGSVYLSVGNRVRRIDRDGIIHAFAGTTTAGFAGDGGPASAARLNSPRGIAVAPNGSVLIADWGNRRIRRVSPNGTISTIAGNGTNGFGGDTGPATAAQLGTPVDVEVADDGSIYVLQNSGSSGGRIRRITPTGIITRFAGGVGPSCGSTADAPARETCIYHGNDMALGPDGSVYLLYRTSSTFIDRIYRITPDGTMRWIAGTNAPQDAENLADGIPATEAYLSSLEGIDVSDTGVVFFSDLGRRRVRYIDDTGMIRTLVGRDGPGSTGDRGPAMQATLNQPRGVFLGNDGAVFIVEQAGNRVRRVSTSAAGYGEGERLLPSPDHAVLWSFDQYGRHLRTRSAMTGVVLHEFGYDSEGRLVTVTDAYDAVTEIVRDGAGVATAIVGPDGHETSLTMDANGYLASMSNPAGEAHEFTYDAGGLMTEFVTPLDSLHTFDYDAAGRLILDSDAEGGSKALERTRLDSSEPWYAVEVTTALGRTKTIEVDARVTGREIRTVTHPDGTQSRQIQREDGSFFLSRPDGTVFRTDVIADPRFGMLSPTKRREIETPDGVLAVQSSTRQVGLVDRLDLLNVNYIREVFTADGNSFERIFEPATGTAVITSPEGREFLTGFDALGRLTSVLAPSMDPVAFVYDARGRIEEVTVGTGLGARVSSFAYDAEGNLISTTDALGRTTEMAHDPIGRVLEVIRPDLEATAMTYDADGNLVSLTPPGQDAHTFAYDADDRNTLYTPPDLGEGTEATEYVWDEDDALVQVLRPNGQVIDVNYDTAGRVDSIESPDGTLSVTYNPTTGHVDEIEGPGGQRLLYTYDGPLVTQIEATGAGAGVLSWTYGDGMRRETRTVEGVTYPISYDADGLLLGVGDVSIARSETSGLPTAISAGDVVTAVSFGPTGALVEVSSEFDSTALLSFEYERDALDRVLGVTETRAGVTTVTDYTYDAAGRLETVSVGGLEVFEYGYDANGNRESVTTGSGTTTATFDAHDRLVEQGGVEYAYAVTGELLSRTEGLAITQYEHDAFGRLRAVELPDATLIEYDLDAMGRRVAKRVDDVLERAWLYDGQLDPVAELDDEGEVVSRFVYASLSHTPDLIERDGNQYRVLTDHLGSVRLVVDVETGTIAQRLEYGPWGEVLLDTNPGFQPFGYAGGIYDADTGLVQFGAREYDAELGRWVSRDPALFDGGVNLFAYAANDPVNLVDPDGRSPATSPSPGIPPGANGGAYPPPGGGAANGAGYPLPGNWLNLLITLCTRFPEACMPPGLSPEPDVEPRDPYEDPCPEPWTDPPIIPFADDPNRRIPPPERPRERCPVTERRLPNFKIECSYSCKTKTVSPIIVPLYQPCPHVTE